ncbi:MAG: DUF1385 domain-containing protein [Deltaproteobacteria bacterium]|nr:DUF1385 domain-containing protein [Deltaproteobacteria bacterium]
MGENNINIGGQAVIGGVMMRGATSMAVAVRSVKGHIVVQDLPWKSFIKAKASFFKIPFLRGIIVFIETVFNGLCALRYSVTHDLKENTPLLQSEKSRNYTFAGSFIVATFFVTLGFIYVPHILSEFLIPSTTSVSFHVLDGVIKISLFVFYLFMISKLSDIQTLFQYHGAEHKSIYAYEAQEELTVANARKYSTLHPRCGTSFVVFILIVSLIVFALVLPPLVLFLHIPLHSQVSFVILKLLLMFPIAGISYELIKKSQGTKSVLFSLFCKPGLFLQKLTTQEPTDEQLEVALAALKRVI